MNYLSVCSGVEAASQAWGRLGWKAVAFSEIEPFPCAVLASRFPDVPNLGDMSKIHYDRKTKELTNGTVRVVCDGGIDLLVGGTPCQSFSVAGKRAGLEGASGLAYHYARLIGEIRPRWFVWENVPGALSSVTYGDQRDFNFLLQQFAVGGDASLGCRWDLCWRVLDTQYVRVEHFARAIPQRRRRVFVVGHLAADGGGGCEVLLEPEGVRGDIAPRRVKGEGTAGDIAKGAGGADGEKRVTYPINSMIIGKDAKEGDRQTTVIGDAGDPLPTLQSAHHHAVAYGINPQNGSLMTPCTKEVGQTNAVGHENGVAIAYDGYNQRAWDEVSFTQRSAASGTEGNDADVKVAIRTEGTDGTEGTADGVECLTPSADHPQTHRVYGTNGAYPSIMSNGGKAGQDQSAICVGVDGANGQAVAFKLDATRSNSMKSANPHSGIHKTDVHCALDTTDPNPTKAQGGVVIAQGVDFYNQTVADTSMTLASAAATDKNHFGGVAIGIGRDAFNSGKNAQMAQSFSTEVQPPITAKGPGGVCGPIR